MHNSSYLRMNWFKETFLMDKENCNIKILDIGAYDVNGSYKPIFLNENWQYVGLDMEEGPNVDVVVKDCYNWSEIPSGTFDVIVSGQAFEHMDFFWLVMEEIKRVLKPNGLCCIIAPSSGPEHKYPVDCYRFYSDGMVAMAKYVEIEVLHVSTGKQNSDINQDIFQDENELWKDSILVARKNISTISTIRDKKEQEQELLNIIEEQKNIIDNFENSTCWKITAPIRKVLDYIKRKG